MKLHRNIQKWEWKSDPNMVALWIHILTKANFEPNRWQGITIGVGQLVTGRKQLAADTGISQQSIRTCLERLKSTNEVTIKTTANYSIITVTKWEDYQDINQVSNQRSTNDQPHLKNLRKKDIGQSGSSTGENANTVAKQLQNEQQTEAFELFWKVYPRKVAKQKAKAAYLKALSIKDVTPALLLNNLHKYADSVNDKDAEYIAHAASWLNGQRWDDEAAGKKKYADSPNTPKKSDIDLEAIGFDPLWNSKR